MLKGQDVLILCILLTELLDATWTQRDLAYTSGLSLSEANQSLKRLAQANLFNPKTKNIQREAAREFLLHALMYVFPVNTGELTRGIPTAIGAPIFAKHFDNDDDAIPVWPHAKGTRKGRSLAPLYKTIPKIILERHHPKLYDVLALVDALRSGKTRERALAKTMIDELLFKEIKRVDNSFATETGNRGIVS